MLPTFLIVGAPKAGTTSVAAYLAGHPDVFVAPEKEVHFFDQHFEKGIDWYQSRFAGAEGERAVGEGSPTYMIRDEWVARMAEVVPHAKLIAVLRNPVDRAYSHYWWMRALYERRSFEEGIRAEKSGAEDPPLFGYLAEGRYVEHLERLARWYPRSSVAVVVLEEMRRSPEETFSELCRFLDVNDTVRPANLGSVLNTAYRLRFPRLRVEMMRFHAWRRLPRVADRLDRWNRVPFTYPPMSAEIRSELAAYFAEHNAALESWLGRKVSVWDPRPVSAPE